MKMLSGTMKKKPSRLLFTLLMAALLFAGCTSNKTIVNNLQERDANEIVVLLASHGIKAVKAPAPAAGGGVGEKIQLWDIQVPPSDALRAMSILNDAGLPRIQGQNLLQIFGKGGLVPSDAQEKIRYQAGLAQQIASVLRKFDGVLNAHVILSIPAPNPMNPTAPTPPPTASVYIKHNGVLDQPNSLLVSKIKRFVAASVPGMTYDNVTVIGEKASLPELLPPPSTGETQHLVSVWSIELSQNSLTLFRSILFSEMLLIILLIIALAFVFWKFMPLIKKSGFKGMFISKGALEQNEEAEEEQKSKEQSPRESPDKREREDI